MQGLWLSYLLSTSLAAATGEASPLERFEISQPIMGTWIKVVLYAPDEPTAKRAFAVAFERMGRIDKTMSDYDSESEVMRLCRSAPTPAPVPVSEDLCCVLTAAQELSRRTAGAFDVTVGPLTRLWRRARRQQKAPDPEQLRAALACVGYQNLAVDPEHRTVELRRPEMRIDLGAIAKGYAADVGLAALDALGLRRALIDVGGQVAVTDPPPERAGWLVAIAPLEPKAKPSHFLQLCRRSVATSGDAWQFVEIDGKRYSHILDPHTGLGLTARSSVSVIAPSGMAADGLATAVSVLGVEKGLALIEDTADAAALIVVVEDNAVRTHLSKRFASYLDRAAPKRP